jgi:hypothetical protein
MKKPFIFALALFLFILTAVVVKSAATVNISPSMPSDNSNLICTVSDSTEDYDFYWYKNGQQFRIDYGTLSAIGSAETSAGEEWKCVAYTPLGNQVGEATVTIPGVFSTNGVVINPNNPSSNDDITCSVSDSTEDYDFYWYKNNEQFAVNYGSSSTILASETTPGDNWKCIVYTPFANKVGEAAVLIDSSQTGTVGIEPQIAYTNDNLSAFVSGINEYFNYNWYKNGQLFKTEYVINSEINAADTSKHDNWTVMVYTPLYNELVGEDSVEILNSAPVITSVNAPSSINAGDTLNLNFSVTDADNDDLTYFIIIDGSILTDTNSYSLITTEADAGIHSVFFYVTDGEDYSYESKQIEILSKAIPVTPPIQKKVDIYNLEITAFSSPEGNFLKIRNLAHSISGVSLKIQAVDFNDVDSYSLDIGRNIVKIIPLNFDFKPQNSYLLKLEITSEDFDGYDYMLVEA